jgi:hypothetical protein
MSFGPQEICERCGKINYAGRIVCSACDRYDDEEAIPTLPIEQRADALELSRDNFEDSVSYTAAKAEE